MDNWVLWSWARVVLQWLSSLALTHIQCKLTSINYYYYYYYSKLLPGVYFIMPFFMLSLP